MTIDQLNDSEQLRLFVAIDPPDAVRTELEKLAEPLRGVVWIPPSQYHLTMRFIGEVNTTMREPIETALATIDVESFVLPVEGIGSFPSAKRPNVLWAGVGRAHPRLYQLRQRVDDALLACSLELDVRSFHPHFTFARCGRTVSSSRIAQFLRRHQDFEGPSFRVDAFTLFSSELKPFGAIHTPLLRVVLRRE